VLRQIAQEFAKRFGSVKSTASYQPVNLSQVGLSSGYMPCYSHGHRE